MIAPRDLAAASLRPPPAFLRSAVGFATSLGSWRGARGGRRNMEDGSGVQRHAGAVKAPGGCHQLGQPVGGRAACPNHVGERLRPGDAFGRQRRRQSIRAGLPRGQRASRAQVDGFDTNDLYALEHRTLESGQPDSTRFQADSPRPAYSRSGSREQRKVVLNVIPAM